MAGTAFIVQDNESGLFLCPCEGSVGFCSLIRDAGTFFDAEEAFLTAVDHLDVFTIVEIIQREKPSA